MAVPLAHITLTTSILPTPGKALKKSLKRAINFLKIVFILTYLDIQNLEYLKLHQHDYLNYIFVREGCIEASEAARATCEVPLGPG